MLVLTQAKLRILFAAICVSERLVRRASKILREDTFTDAYAVYRFILDVLLEYFDEHGRLPSPPVLRSNLLADMAGNEYSDESDEQELAEVYRLVESLVTEDPDFLVKSVTPYMDAFKEQCIRERLKEVIDSVDLGEMLKTTQVELRQALVTDTDKFDNPLGSSLDQRKPGKFTMLGNPLIDIYTGGTGPATGEVIGHAAPSGGGKTTLSSQIALDATMIAIHEATKNGARPTVTYIFNYEMLLGPLSNILAYGARVPRTTIEEYLNSVDTSEVFSRGRDYKPYEVKKFRKHLSLAASGNGPYPLAEWDRIQRLRNQIKDSLYIVDFTGGNDKLTNYANRFVDGIDEFIQEHQLSVGSPGVTAVFLDYASAIARSYTAKKNRETEYELLVDLPLQVKRKITNPLRCWSFISHQLAAEEGDKAGGTRPNPTKWKGCKSFCENCDFGFVNGKATEETFLSIFVQAKVRRGKPQPDQVGQLNGEYSNWQPAGGDLVITGNRVVERDEARKMAGVNARIAIDQA